METIESRDGLMISEHLKVSIYFPILDAILSELDHRFAEKKLEHMRSIQAYSPCSPNFLRPNSIRTLAESYEWTRALSVECLLAKSTLYLERTCIVLLMLMFFLNYPHSELPFQCSPSYYRLLTIVVSTAHCERSFSALN